AIRALDSLSRALTLTAPEGYVRLFADLGAPMAGLLAQSVERRAQSDPIRVYAERLLSAFPSEQGGETSGTSGAPPVLRPALERSNALVEPLSARELEVLRLIATGRSNQAIAQTLIIAESTVKMHLKNIYGKLDAHSRTQAIARARELGLL